MMGQVYLPGGQAFPERRAKDLPLDLPPVDCCYYPSTEEKNWMLWELDGQGLAFSCLTSITYIFKMNSDDKGTHGRVREAKNQ